MYNSGDILCHCFHCNAPAKWREIFSIFLLKKILTRTLTHIHTHTPLGLFLIFLAIVKNYYFCCCVLGGWVSSAAPWRKSLNPTVATLWLLAAEWMETQWDDAPTGEKRKGLFTGRFKASLVLLSDTQQSAGGEPGWHKQNRSESTGNQQAPKNKKKTKPKNKPQIQAKEPSVQNESVYCQMRTRKLNAMPAWSVHPLWLCGRSEQRNYSWGFFRRQQNAERDRWRRGFQKRKS